MQSYHYAHSQRAPRVPSRHHINATTIMRLHIKYLLGCLALLFLLPACKGESDVEEATLDLSDQSVTFTKDGGEQTLTVSTNKDSWSAFTTERSWLTVEQQGNTLKVKATANDRGMDRAASVVVNAGGMQRVVDVKQSAADVILDADATSLTFPAAGETKKLAISSNGGTVKAELASAVDWLTIDKVTPTAIVLTAKESLEKYRRRVKVLLTVGTTLTEIEAIQEGSVQYVLPILKFPASLATVMSEEIARGNALIQLPDGLFNTTSYRVATRSEAMPFIQYEFTDPSAPGFKSAMSICADSTLVKDNPEFMAFVKEQGFDAPTVSKDGNTTTYTSESLQLQIEVTIQPKGAVITTTYRPTQRKSYKTFDVMPLAEQLKLLSSRELDIMKAKRAEIRKQEAEWGSEWAEPHDRKYYDRFMVTKAFDGEFARGYFYIVADKYKKIPEDDPYVDAVKGIQAIYHNTELAFWRDYAGDFHLSNEVIKLLEDNGYTFLQNLEGYSKAYYNKEKKLAFIFTVPKQTYQGRYILEIQATYADRGNKSATLSVATLSDYPSYLRALRAQQAEDRAFAAQLKAIFGH